MSGIAGIFYLDGRPVEPHRLGGMVDAIEHRGPDGRGLWRDGSVGLGHQMLHTTPESLHETQPLVRRSGDLVLTADARLDNRDELITALRPLKTLRPPEPEDRPVTDAELILAAYERWGEACPEHLLGAFAFALWDGRKRQLFCARDHFGVKPFYYHHAPGRRFIFASEIKAVLARSGVPRDVNEVWIADQLEYFEEDVEHTLFRGVRRLPPAHWLSVSRDGIQSREYWSLDPEREVQFSAEREYVKAFRSCFMEAVRCRLRSVGRPGSMLSGGLDSSSVACAARHIVDDEDPPLHTFSAVFDDVPESDERPFIQSVLEKYQFEPHYIPGDRISPFVSLTDQRLPEAVDEPVRAPNLHLNWHAYERAQACDVRVVLDGFDGDTTVSHGTGRFHELARTGQWISFVKEAYAYGRTRDRKAWSIIGPYLQHYAVNPVLGRVRGYGRLRQLWQSIRGTRSDRGQQSDQLALLDPDFAARIDWPERRRTLLQGRSGPPRTERELHHRLLTQGGMPAALETLDRTAALFEVEVRYPFWDKRLVELCLALPPDMKLHQGWPRRVLRLAMDGILPPDVQWRRDKSNIGFAFDRMLRTYGQERMKKLVQDPTHIGPYANIDRLREAYARFEAEEATDDDPLHLWNALTLEMGLSRLDRNDLVRGDVGTAPLRG